MTTSDIHLYGNIVQLELPEQWLQFFLLRGVLREGASWSRRESVYELTPKGGALLTELLQILEMLSGGIQEIATGGEKPH
jgi:DNA-binding PadR family transcriptional regulator